MPRKPEFPLVIRNNSVTVKVYRQTAPTNKDGYAYVVAWVAPSGRQKKTFADFHVAKSEAELRASQMASGLMDAQLLSRSDVLELRDARGVAEEHGMPLMSAISEWAEARKLAGPSILNACNDWARRRASDIQRILVKDAVDKFIEAKNDAQKRGTRTYESKLKGVKEAFSEYYLDSVTASDWTRYLGKYEDAVTRNDLRKRIVTLCRWAQRHGHIRDDATPQIEKTERAKETARPIGILTPAAYEKILIYFRKAHPEYLAAVVLAGFCGLRADEIQGKRDDREKRQSWEDIRLNDGFLSVSAAKENTPSNRMVHLSEAAKAWLSVCKKPHKGPVCHAGAMEKARLLARAAKFRLPGNCFRHSWISYRIALTGNKAETATEAGNSVKEIDRRYRVPRPKSEGASWFAIRPK